MTSDSLDRYANELETRGYTIVPNVLDAAEIETARRELANIWNAEKDVGQKNGWHNESWIVAYMLPAKHPFFRQLPLNPRVVPLMQKILGPDCILSSLNGLMMVPQGKSQRLHLDQPQHVPNLVININATYTLDDFTVANGCTRVVPFSQNRAPHQPINHDEDEKNVAYLEAPAGSLLAFNGGIVHAGSANKTASPRRCIHSYYSRPWVRSQWDFARSFSDDVKATLTEEQKRLFGFYAHEQVYLAQTHETVRA